MKALKILVSHPAKQHVHHLCLALQKKAWLQRFYTSLWYKPDHSAYKIILPLLPNSILLKLKKELKKRFFQPLNPALISTRPIYEVLSRLFGYLGIGTQRQRVKMVDRKHDHWVASKIRSDRPDIIIGYENACLQSFKAAKQVGITTILDIAQIHHDTIRQIRDRHPEFRKSLNDEPDFEEENAHKAEQYQYTDYVLTLSTFARQSMLDAGFPPEKVFTVNLGFDPARFTPKTSYYKNEHFSVIFVGTLTHRKGIELLLECWQELNLAKARLKLVGPVADAQQVLKQYEGTFEYVPFLHHEELVKEYQQADLFVFPSYLDSWAMVVLEAMACGTPVIVTENTGSKDAVGQGGGKVIPAGDKKALKQAISNYYTNRHSLEKEGRQAAHVAKAYTWENYYNKIQQVITCIAGKKEISNKIA